MLYTIIRLIIAGAAAIIAFVMLNYSREDGRRKRRSRNKHSDKSILSYSVAIFFTLALVLNFIPAENWLIDFDTPESAFSYNNVDKILEISEYTDCALVIASTADGEITTHVVPKKNGKWSLETVYNRRRDVTTKNYCIAERLYVPNSNDCFVIINHSTSGSIGDAPSNVADSHNTKFTAVSYPDTLTFYYGFVQNMDDNYTVHVDGEKIKFE